MSSVQKNSPFHSVQIQSPHHDGLDLISLLPYPSLTLLPPHGPPCCSSDARSWHLSCGLCTYYFLGLDFLQTPVGFTSLPEGLSWTECQSIREAFQVHPSYKTAPLLHPLFFSKLPALPANFDTDIFLSLSFPPFLPSFLLSSQPFFLSPFNSSIDI